ncbi:MAG: hypothetical protein Ta2F_09390 [Termitinemataceae bacterium]|nr:MAG: hypothetical protein Ta2F_09390 [Termitinemataceae bacterium]
MSDEKEFVMSKEFESLDFNSKRLENRFVQIYGNIEPRAARVYLGKL